MYGPTETTVWSTCGRVELGQGGVSIGRPIDNTEVWILDDAGALVPIGVPGELYIGGDGVALGYHARPELTDERFVPDRFSSRPGGAALPHRRPRRAGAPTASSSTSGAPTSRSRSAATASSSARSRSRSRATPRSPRPVVVAQPGPGGEQRLVAYLVPARVRRPGRPALREHLRASLPDYMIPAVFVAARPAAAHPQRQGRSPRPAGARGAARGPRRRPPRCPAARAATASSWSRPCGASCSASSASPSSDNFLDLGGHSLLIMQAIAKLEARTGKRVSPRTFIFQTLEQIARDYDGPRPEAPRPTRPPPPPPPTSRLSRWLSSLIPGSKP